MATISEQGNLEYQAKLLGFIPFGYDELDKYNIFEDFVKEYDFVKAFAKEQNLPEEELDIKELGDGLIKKIWEEKKITSKERNVFFALFAHHYRHLAFMSTFKSLDDMCNHVAKIMERPELAEYLRNHEDIINYYKVRSKN